MKPQFFMDCKCIKIFRKYKKPTFLIIAKITREEMNHFLMFDKEKEKKNFSKNIFTI